LEQQRNVVDALHDDVGYLIHTRGHIAPDDPG
jgi:hypothetical protein